MFYTHSISTVVYIPCTTTDVEEGIFVIIVILYSIVKVQLTEILDDFIYYLTHRDGEGQRENRKVELQNPLQFNKHFCCAEINQLVMLQYLFLSLIFWSLFGLFPVTQGTTAAPTTNSPTFRPTRSPTISLRPTRSPSACPSSYPTSDAPSFVPSTAVPSVSFNPTLGPSPSIPTPNPSPHKPTWSPSTVGSPVGLCPFHVNLDKTLQSGAAPYSFPTHHPLMHPVMRPHMPSGIVCTYCASQEISCLNCFLSY